MEYDCRYCGKLDVHNFCTYKDYKGEPIRISLCDRCINKIKSHGKFCYVCGIKTDQSLNLCIAESLSKTGYDYDIYICCLGECRVKVRKECFDIMKEIETTTDKKIFSKACNYCRESMENGKICGKCKCANYCDVECQRNDWPEHKKFCVSRN